MNIKQITEEIYLDKAQNGARKLVDIGDYRLLDGVKNEDESYFIIDFENELWYEIDLKTCYDLFTMYLYGDKKYLMGLLDGLKEGKQIG